MTEQYDNRGKVALWKNDAENPEAPYVTGTVTAHRNIREGEEVQIALWVVPAERRKSNSPVMRGKIQDKQQKQQQGGGSDIPF